MGFARSARNVAAIGLRRRKFHSMFKHWIGCIREFGAPYFYSGEANEEFHKIAAKVMKLHLTSSRRLLGMFSVGVQTYQ